MKKIQIEIRIPEGEEESKVATGIKTSGFSDNSMFDQFAILGALENVKDIVLDRLNKLNDIQL